MTANRVGWGPRDCRKRRAEYIMLAWMYLATADISNEVAHGVCDKLIRGISLTRQGVAWHFPTKFTDSQIESGKEIDRIRKEETWQILDRKIIMDE